jgi:hypothetical protein
METTTMRRLLVIGTWLTFTCVALPVSADDPATESLIRRGVELRKADRNEDALDMFQKAHALTPSGRTLAQMGLAEFSLKRFVDAENHLAAALTTDLPWVVHNRAPLEQALASVRSHVAIVDIVGPDGAEVAVNGRSVGRLPLLEPVHIAEGSIRIEGTAPNHQPSALDVTVAGGRGFKVTLDLSPITPALPAQLAQLLPAGPQSAAARTADASSAGWRPWAEGGLLAASAVAITAGVIWLAVDNDSTCNIPSIAPAGSRCSRLYDTKAQGWTAIGVGALAGLGGALLLWQAYQPDVQIGLGPRSLAAIGHF